MSDLVILKGVPFLCILGVPYAIGHLVSVEPKNFLQFGLIIPFLASFWIVYTYIMKNEVYHASILSNIHQHFS